MQLKNELVSDVRGTALKMHVAAKVDKKLYLCASDIFAGTLHCCCCYCWMFYVVVEHHTDIEAVVYEYLFLPRRAEPVLGALPIPPRSRLSSYEGTYNTRSSGGQQSEQT